MSGVSVEYVTRLEQGRDQHPSASVVRALADTLRLTDAERSHLHLLAGIAEPRRYDTDSGVRSSVTSLLDALMPAPAYVVTPIGDFVAWNDATAVLWVDPGTLLPRERNLARMTLLDPRMRELWIDWPLIAREAVAHLRSASARFPDDARLGELLTELTSESADFRRWWDDHDVSTRRAPRKRFAHPTHGELSFFNEAMELLGEGLLFMVYVPADAVSLRVCTELAASPTKSRLLRAVDTAP